MADFTGTIQNAEIMNGHPVKVEDLFELLGTAIKEAKGDSKRTDFFCEDERKLILQTRYVLQYTNFVLSKYSERFEEILGDSSEDILSLEEQCREKEEKLAEIEKSIVNENHRKERLTQTVEQLEKEKARLLGVQSECKSLEERVTALSIPELVGIDKVHEELKKTLEEKSGKVNAAIEEIVNALTKNVGFLSGELQSKTRRCKELQDELNGISTHQEELNARIAGMEAQRKSLEALIAELGSKEVWLNKQSGLFATSYTALNSFLNEEFFERNVFLDNSTSERISIKDIPGVPFVGRRINSIDELKAWITDVQNMIEKLLDVYRGELKELVLVSESMTAPAKDAL